MDVGGGSKQVKLKDGVTIVAKGSKRAGDWAIAQLDVLGLSHNAVGVGDGEVGKAAMIFFKALRALCIWFL